MVANLSWSPTARSKRTYKVCFFDFWFTNGSLVPVKEDGRVSGIRKGRPILWQIEYLIYQARSSYPNWTSHGNWCRFWIAFRVGRRPQRADPQSYLSSILVTPFNLLHLFFLNRSRLLYRSDLNFWNGRPALLHSSNNDHNQLLLTLLFPPLLSVYDMIWIWFILLLQQDQWQKVGSPSDRSKKQFEISYERPWQYQ